MFDASKKNQLVMDSSYHRNGIVKIIFKKKLINIS